MKKIILSAVLLCGFSLGLKAACPDNDYQTPGAVPTKSNRIYEMSGTIEFSGLPYDLDKKTSIPKKSPIQNTSMSTNYDAYNRTGTFGPLSITREEDALSPYLAMISMKNDAIQRVEIRSMAKKEGSEAVVERTYILENVTVSNFNTSSYTACFESPTIGNDNFSLNAGKVTVLYKKGKETVSIIIK